MKNIVKTHFLWWLVFLSTVLIWYIGYAAYSGLPIQPAWTTITQTIWNDVINKINDIWSRVEGIYSNWGNIGVWTNAPSAKLEISGNIKISDGTQWTGKVLTSDANGIASWNNPSDHVLNNQSQNSWALPQSAWSTVVGAWGYYDHGNFSVTPWVYMWFVYNCGWQLTYASWVWNDYTMVWTPVVYSSSNWSNLYTSLGGGNCWVIYTWVVKVNSTGVIRLRITSYLSSVLVTPWPTSNSFVTTLVKIN